jgi:hypothetical protein
MNEHGWLLQHRRLHLGAPPTLTYLLNDGSWGPLLVHPLDRAPEFNPRLAVFDRPGAVRENQGYITPTQAAEHRLGLARAGR